MDRRPPEPPAALRVLAVGLLLVVVVVGLRALGEASLPDRPRLPLGLLLTMVGALWAAMLVLALMILATGLRRGRPQRKRAPAPVRYGRGLVILGLILLIGLNPEPLRRMLDRLRPPAEADMTGDAGSPDAGGDGGLQAVATSTVTVLCVVAVLLAVLAVVHARQRRRALAATSAEPPPATAPLATVVAAGERAIAIPRDTREAIIACYLAMERELARLGTARGAAETPAELLDRAEVDGLLPRSAAETLLQLFAEARFSSHPLTAADRAAAEQALADLRTALQRTQVSR